jgi:ectoine hydroxylase-related dioxygenase (phytanoyl-CoA dioxygenase family)
MTRLLSVAPVRPADIEAYDRDGAVMLEQPFEAFWIEGLVRAFEDIQRDFAAGTFKGDIFEQAGRLEITGALGHHPFIRRWALESPAAQIVAKVIGSRQIRLYTDHDVAFGKRGPEESARIGATSFHIDGSAWGFRGAMVPSFWLALTDVGETHGPLLVAAGSHRKMDKLILPSPNDPGQPVPDGYAPYASMESFLDQHRFEMKVFPARRGDVVILHPCVAHGSLPMSRDGFRLALSTRWLGDDACWHVNPQTLEEARDAGAAVDGAPPADSRYPVIWDAERGALGHLPGIEAIHRLDAPKPKFQYREFGRVETQRYLKA